jgi:hypothetical protein
VYFETNIKVDFLKEWKAVPEGYSKTRVLFEARYDDKEAGFASEADVYYDDLYMGPARRQPQHALKFLDRPQRERTTHGGTRWQCRCAREPLVDEIAAPEW